MRNWTACSNYLILFLSLFFFLFLAKRTEAQISTSSGLNSTFAPAYNLDTNYGRLGYRSIYTDTTDTTGKNITPGLPNPKSVMYKSMIIPGWGQIINKQAWKVPIVYGILGGLGWYSVYLTKRYHDYRAAYYNLNPEVSNNDLRFGPTPDYIPESANLEQLRSIRNTYRNRRDLTYVAVVLAYGLNLVDAYVFAHMRSFDVSEDLSMRPSVKPTLMAHSAPGFSLSIDLITK